MKIPVIASALLMTLLGTTAAEARPRYQPLRVPVEVLQVVTAERDNGRFRGIVGEQGGNVFVQLERLAIGRRGWVTTTQERYDVFVLGDRILDMRGARIDNVMLRRRVMSFDLDVGERLSCRVRLDSKQNQYDDPDGRYMPDPRGAVVRCSDRWDNDDAWYPQTRPLPPVHHDPRIDPIRPEPIRPEPVRPEPIRPERPQPQAPQWAASPDIIRACGDAFIGSNANACLDTVRNFNFNPFQVIRTCSDHVIGDPTALQCLQRAGAYYNDPSAIIAACDDAMVGDANTLACLDVSTGARMDPVPTIKACAQASIGDPASLECLRRAFGR